MTGFEPGSSDIGSDGSANCATTTAPSAQEVFKMIINFVFMLHHFVPKYLL